jgi:peptidoglycan/LPS O-acetylase OafA/YrhL
VSAARGYRPSLDGLRAVAITLVMAEHAKLGVARAGGLGVDVFFVLSGFLITGLLTAEQTRSGRISFRAFYLRRASRLYPALIALVTVGGAVVAHEQKAPLRTLVKAGLIASTYLTDLFTFGHSTVWALWGQTWSLAIEEHFYLLWPPILLFLLRRASRRAAERWALAGAAVGAAAAVLLAVPGHGGPPTFYFQPQAHAGALLLGCAVALRPRWPDWTRHLGGPALLLLLAVVVVSPSPVHVAYYRISLPVVWVLTAALLVGLENASRTARALAWEPWRLIGLVSYGLYLYHQLVFSVVARHLDASRPVLVATQVAVSLAVAAVSYHFLEAPIRQRGRRLAEASTGGSSPRPTPRPVADEAPADRPTL